jgi:hypothetical protein
MNLNFDSNTAKLYRWVYAKNSMPQNLCPYFWKVVLMYFIIIPYAILSLPYLFMKGKDRGDDFAEKPVTGFFIYIALGLAASMLFSISVFWYTAPKDSFLLQMQILGILLWIVAIAISIYHGVKYIRRRIEESKIKYDENGYRIWEAPKPKEPNLFVEWVKATYNEYCPRIEWSKTKN